METALILHLPAKDSQSSDTFQHTLDSIFSQTNALHAVVALAAENSIDLPADYSDSIQVFQSEGENLSYQLNQALDDLDTDYVIYLDNQTNPVILKNACLDMFYLAAHRNPDAGLIYADYELLDGDELKEVHLFNHHKGRLRDNQDYGKVFFFDRDALDQVYGFDESLEYNALYDIRLKLSENCKLVRLANKYNGSLYQVIAARKKADVFDYLLAGKDVQLEAEAVLSEHLKRTHSYLEPGAEYQSRPEEKIESELVASIIIPVNNRPEFMAPAIASVQDQTIKDIEVIIVVNGGEDDPTIPEVKRYMEGGDLFAAKKPAVQLVVVDINNIGFCLNMGVRYARGKYYVQLDSDDRLKPDAVEKIVDVFEKDNQIGMVIGSYEVWEKQDSGELVRREDIPVVTHDEWTEENGRNNLLRINGAGAPRSIPLQIIKSMGYFGINDEPYTQNYGEDYDMVLRISEKYKIGRIHDPIYEVIRHSGGTDHSIDQVTINRNDEAKDRMRLKAIQRRKDRYSINGKQFKNRGRFIR